MSFKIVNTIHIPGLDFGKKLLESMDAELVNALSRTEEEIISNAADADAVICSGPVQPWTARVIQSLSKCRIIASLGVGYDRIDLETATNKGIVVANTPDYCIDEVSGQAITLMLALGRKIFQADKAVRERQINFVPPNRKNLTDIVYPLFRISEQTLGIVGLGRIGTAVALKARGLGMRVIAYDPYIFKAVMRSLGVEPADFDTLIKTSDFISINASLNEETRNMFGHDEFRRMKPTCYLINTARGEIVNQPALVKALQEGLLAGAGLDVTTDDPMSGDNPLLSMPNVILTGHSGWYSATSDSKFWHRAMTQVVLALRGEWPIYAVNPDVQEKWLEKWGKIGK
ncbi:C-terminal binding protein [Desulfobacterales bacterium HSG2]|nr:C-terminal binding protein [Desulfobacterales bacterium HSG2]